MIRDLVFVGNETEMAEALDLSQSTLNRSMAGRTKTISRKVLLGLTRAGYSTDWLETGKGSPRLDGKQLQNKTRWSEEVKAKYLELHGSFTRSISEPQTGQLYRVPALRVEVGAGDEMEVWTEFEDDDEAEYLPAAVVRRVYGVGPDRIRKIRVRGNSMHPTLQPGQWVRVILRNGEPLIDGSIYVLSSTAGALIKRLVFDGAKIRVTSDNPNYPMWTIPMNEFDEQYRVVARLASSWNFL